jgi:GT2 family glycosyltransferase
VRRLDIGIASYGNANKLYRTVESIRKMSTTDWRLNIVDNPHPTEQHIKKVLANLENDPKITVHRLEENVGYAGAVNKIFELAETEYVAYTDNDVVVQTKGWDETLCVTLDRFHELGMVYPNNGFFPIQRDNYQEVLWGIGFCWVLNRVAMADVGEFDAEIGHQEEADYALRLRLAGYRLGALPGVQVHHDATASSNPASRERISRGVIRWMNKWCAYFCGRDVNYHSANVLRWEDWPPNALHLEKYWKSKPEMKGLNDEPVEIRIDGTQYDMICVPRLSGFYRGRII